MQDFIEALQNDMGYAWLSEHSIELGKDEVCSIAKELLYSIEQCDTKEEIIEDVCTNISESYV